MLTRLISLLTSISWWVVLTLLGGTVSLGPQFVMSRTTLTDQNVTLLPAKYLSPVVIVRVRGLVESTAAQACDQHQQVEQRNVLPHDSRLSSDSSVVCLYVCNK